MIPDTVILVVQFGGRTLLIQSKPASKCNPWPVSHIAQLLHFVRTFATDPGLSPKPAIEKDTATGQQLS
jgi:hypothetical protein